MTEDEALARAAGLERAWRDHQADVIEAIAGARRLQRGFKRPTEATAEPLPAYAAPRA